MRGRGTLRAVFAALTLALAAMTGTGCGGDEPTERTTATTPAPELKQPMTYRSGIDVDLKDFPETDGKVTITDLLSESAANRDLAVSPGAQEFVQGEKNRYPFGLFTRDNKPAWGQTVMYLAESRDSPAIGPFPAPAIPLDVPEEFRSQNARSEYDSNDNAIYVSEFKAPKGAKQLEMLTLSRIGNVFHASNQSIGFRDRPATPAIGDKAPVIDTRTVEDVGGPTELSKICTRTPFDTMHDIEMKSAIKKHQPVVLVFATPKHCVSRICAPVVDIAEYLNSKYSDQAAFIHQEIYNNNVVKAGYVEAIAKYGLPNEPYTFVIDSDGRVAHKFEGPVTIQELENAVIDVTGKG